MAAICSPYCETARATNEGYADRTVWSVAHRAPCIRRCAGVLLRELERTGVRAHRNPRSFRPGQSLALRTGRTARAALSDLPAARQARPCCRRRNLRCRSGYPPQLTDFWPVGGCSPECRIVQDAVDSGWVCARLLRAE